MELWLDTCHLETIMMANQLGMAYGVTTNPTLLAKTNQDPAKVIEKLLEVQEGPVAVQVTSEDCDGMLQQAKHWRTRSDRLIIKVPITKEGLKAINELAQDGVPTMATSIFHQNQALLAALAKADYLAPYLGRMFDAGIDAWVTLKSMVTIFRQYSFKTKILVAAIKSTEHITLCAEMGVDAMTIKKERFSELIEEHHLTQQWIKMFAQDWEEVEEKYPSMKTYTTK